MLNLKAGRLRHKIQIVRTVPGVQDPETGYMGDPTHTTKTVWAEFAPLSGREFIAAGAVQSQVSARVTIRPIEVTTADTVIHKGTKYNIVTVLPDPDTGNAYYTLLVELQHG